MERQHPNIITADGTTVEQGYYNDDNDLSNIQSVLSNMNKNIYHDFTIINRMQGNSTGEAVITDDYKMGRRQYVHNMKLLQKANGSEMHGIGGAISIELLNGNPIKLCFAGGFDANGPVNYYVDITMPVYNAWDMTELSSGYNTIIVVYSDGKLSYKTCYYCDQRYTCILNPTTGIAYYNKDSQRMYIYNGSQYVPILAIPIATIDTTGREYAAITYTYPGVTYGYRPKDT